MSADRKPPSTTIWHEETIEVWLDDKHEVYVFRHVPDYLPVGGRRKDHPTYDEWLADMKAAGEGLQGPTPQHRTWYDMDQFGVGGHRPWTPEEHGQRIAYLTAEAARIERSLNAARASSSTSQSVTE